MRIQAGLGVAFIVTLLAAAPGGCSEPFLADATDGGADALVEAPRPRACIEPEASDAPRDPVEYGARELGDELEARGVSRCVHVVTRADPRAAAVLATSGAVLDARPEAYAIAVQGSDTFVIGADPVGAMYGAFELAERLRLDGAAAAAPDPPVTAAPAVAIRAANPFLVLPEPGEGTWWFFDDGYWTEYLDLLAHARLDVLDLHGMYDTENTVFPNALLHFARSPSFPDVGAPAAERDRNLAMLVRIIEMARVRGIRVALMSYSSGTSLDGSTPGPALSDADLRTYTREAAEDLARRASGLWRLGFRIGESGKDASWYVDTFVAGVKNAGTGVTSYTRTWGTTKPDVLAVASAVGDGLVVEAKYNGEQLASPYAIAGGVLTTNLWRNYTYEDYLNSPAPYRFVFQIRTCSTNRIFRSASFERARRIADNLASGLSPSVAGFTLEPTHAYYPQRDFYHRDPADRFSPWTFRRDELQYLTMGRLTYDPTTPERVFRAQLAKRVGADTLWEAVQAASEIAPWIQSAHTCGPDTRDYAPELELGGPVGYWSRPARADAPPSSCHWGYHGPFDTFAIAGPDEEASALVGGAPEPRLSPLAIAALVDDAATRAERAASASGLAGNAESRDVVRECVALADLGHWFAAKLRAATLLAVYAHGGGADWLAAARTHSKIAVAAFQKMANDTQYIAPFDEHLRMVELGLPTFHWSEEVDRLQEDEASIDAIVAEVTRSPPPPPRVALPAPADWIASPRAPGPGLDALDVAPRDPSATSWQVTARFRAPIAAGAAVRVLWKPFANLSDFQAVPATRIDDTHFVATIGSDGTGALFAVEVVESPSRAWRYPDVTVTQPYLALPPNAH